MNTAIWCTFMSVTLQAAVHLGRDYSLNLRSVKNQSSKSVEHAGLSTIDRNQLVWRESPLLCDRAVRIAKSKTHVFSDSVLYLGGISTDPVQAWTDKIKSYLFGNTLSQRIGSNRRRTDGIRVENFPRIHYVGRSRRDSKDDGRIKV